MRPPRGCSVARSRPSEVSLTVNNAWSTVFCQRGRFDSRDVGAGRARVARRDPVALGLRARRDRLARRRAQGARSARAARRTPGGVVEPRARLRQARPCSCWWRPRHRRAALGVGGDVEIEGHELWGLGAVDDKGGVVAGLPASGRCTRTAWTFDAARGRSPSRSTRRGAALIDGARRGAAPGVCDRARGHEGKPPRSSAGSSAAGSMSRASEARRVPRDGENVVPHRRPAARSAASRSTSEPAMRSRRLGLGAV